MIICRMKKATWPAFRTIVLLIAGIVLVLLAIYIGMYLMRFPAI